MNRKKIVAAVFASALVAVVALGVSLATVKRELRFAHAWLAAELGTTDAASGKSA